jgi:hypothetical protein
LQENKLIFSKTQKTILSTLVVLILVIASVGIIVVKNYFQTIQTNPAKNTVSNSNERPSDIYKQAIMNGNSIMVFVHSNDCDPCIEMIKIVDETYPEFQEEIVLVDVNVYEQQNQGFVSELTMRDYQL